jgi:hypothetical protein
MPSAGNLLTIPPGPPLPLYAQSIEDVVDVTRITVSRAGTVTRLGAWISGDPAGVDPDQPGRFVLYADDGTTQRPGALLARSIEGTVTGAVPQEVCVSLPIDGAPVHIVPGTYWVGVDVGQAQGTGEWRVHGSADPGRGIRITGAIYPSTPNPFPAVGGTIFTNTAAYGLVFEQDPQQILGSIVGTFKVGTRKVGQTSFPLNTSFLRLNGKRTSVIIANDVQIVHIRTRGLLTLKGKPAQQSISIVLSVPRGKLLLTGKTIEIDAYSPILVGKGVLLLTGKTVEVEVHGIATALRPLLLLNGKATLGLIPGLVASPVETLILTPTPVQSVFLAPTVKESIVLAPSEIVIQ